MNRIIWLLVPFALFLAGCGGDDEHASESTVGTVSFAADIQPILSASCGDSCHLIQGGGNTGLDLRPGHSWESLVGVDAANCIAGTDLEFRVEAGSPETSLLWRRISGAPDCGPMPPYGAGGALEGSRPEEVDRIEQWIREGAQDN